MKKRIIEFILLENASYPNVIIKLFMDLIFYYFLPTDSAKQKIFYFQTAIAMYVFIQAI